MNGVLSIGTDYLPFTIFIGSKRVVKDTLSIQFSMCSFVLRLFLKTKSRYTGIANIRAFSARLSLQYICNDYNSLW